MSLILTDISHRFGASQAVRGASLTVGAGEIVCLFGPSGCGKTTLLRIAAGLERLQSGEVRLGDRLLAAPGVQVPPEKRPLGIVFQDYVLFPHLTVADNIGFGLSGRPDKRALCDAQLKAMRLEGLAGRYPHELSGGQQQRVALARALAQKPDALLLDEPFASIDAVLRRHLREELRRVLMDQKAAVILVTHDPEEALALGDRIALMRAGRIIETASPQMLYRRPLTADGAALFPGSQSVAGAIAAGRLETPIGVFDADGRAEGPGVAVCREGALVAAHADAGPFEVVDRRFSGPGWAVYFRAPGGAILRARMDDAPEIGAPISLSFDLDHIFIFENNKL